MRWKKWTEFRDKPPFGARVDWSDPIAERLVGCWLFNEAQGSKLQDLSERGNYGDFVGNVAWDAAPDGSCLLFDGSSSAVDCGNSEDYHSQQEYTYFALISPATVSSSYRAIVVHRYHSKGAVIGYWTRDDDFYWQVRNDDASSGFLETIYHNLQANRWYSVALTINSAGTARFWCNGKSLRERSVNGPFTNFDQPLYIGRHSYSPGSQDFNGKIALVYVFTRGLSPDEIRRLHEEPYSFFLVPVYRYFVVPTGVPSVVSTDTAWRLFTRSEVQLAWTILASIARSTAWRLLTEQDRQLAWLILSEFGRDTAWAITTATSAGTGWRISTRGATDTGWAILTAQGQDTAWRLLTSLSTPSSWAVLAELSTDTAWQILTAGLLSTPVAWRIATAGTHPTAWAVLRLDQRSTAWRVMTALSQQSAWAISTEDAWNTAWAVLHGLLTDTAWSVMGRWGLDTAWSIRTVLSTPTEWAVLASVAAGLGWVILTVEVDDLGWAILAERAARLGWRVLTAEELETAWQVWSSDVGEPEFVFKVRPRGLIFDPRARTFVFVKEKSKPKGGG